MYFNLGRLLQMVSLETNAKVLLDFRNKYLAKLTSVSDENLFVTDKMPQNCFIGLLAAS